jgi:hypothetical protein
VCCGWRTPYLLHSSNLYLQPFHLPVVVLRIRIFFFHNFMWNDPFNALKNYLLETLPYLLHATTISCLSCEFIPEESLQTKNTCFVVHRDLPFHLWRMANFAPFMFQQYTAMAADPLHNAAVSFRVRQGKHQASHPIRADHLTTCMYSLYHTILKSTPGFRYFLPRSHSSPPVVS